jgi:hypothetical protein
MAPQPKPRGIASSSFSQRNDVWLKPGCALTGHRLTTPRVPRALPWAMFSWPLRGCRENARHQDWRFSLARTRPRSAHRPLDSPGSVQWAAGGFGMTEKRGPRI